MSAQIICKNRYFVGTLALLSQIVQQIMNSLIKILITRYFLLWNQIGHSTLTGEGSNYWWNQDISPVQDQIKAPGMWNSLLGTQIESV